MSAHRRGFTLVELLVVIAIIALLVGIAIPGFSAARRIARESRAKANLTSLHNALETFNSELGYYPDSGRGGQMVNGGIWNSAATPADQGAHVLVEALAGVDLVGYSKEQEYAVLPNGEPTTRRYGPYVQAEDIGVGTMAEAQADGTFWIGDANPNPVFLSEVRPGVSRAILYFKANRARRLHFAGSAEPAATQNLIYDYWDNGAILTDTDAGGSLLHKSEDDHDWGHNPQVHFYGKCHHSLWNHDTGTGATPWTSPSARPHNPDTFILVDPGYDTIYGTDDDITNFRQ